jgi:hypothetical protein
MIKKRRCERSFERCFCPKFLVRPPHLRLPRKVVQSTHNFLKPSRFVWDRAAVDSWGFDKRNNIKFILVVEEQARCAIWNRRSPLFRLLMRTRHSRNNMFRESHILNQRLQGSEFHSLQLHHLLQRCSQEALAASIVRVAGLLHEWRDPLDREGTHCFIGILEQVPQALSMEGGEATSCAFMARRSAGIGRALC